METPKVITEVIDQYMKMRHEREHTVESDVKYNDEYELAKASLILVMPDHEQLDLTDLEQFIRQEFPDWDAEWFLTTWHKTYKDRIKVGISLLMAEWERLDYLENKRKNDSSTASNTRNPESDGAAAYPAE